MTKFLFSLLVLSIGFNIYLLQVETVVVDTFEEKVNPKTSDKVKMAQSAVAKNCPAPTQKVIYKCPDMEQQSSEQAIAPHDLYGNKHENELGQQMANYDELQQKWFEKVNDFLELELRLQPEKIAHFHELKSKRNQELDDFFTKLMQKLQAEGNAEDAPFYPSAEDTIEIGKINLKYEKQLLDLLGEQDMQAYQNFKQAFNKSNQNSHVMIDF